MDMTAGQVPDEREPVAAELGPADRGSEPALVADRLISTMASIRRSARRLAARPTSLATLTGAQLELVRLVRRRPGISVSEAAVALRLVPNTVSTLVGQLTDAGMLRRDYDRGDRRVVRLQLAPGTRRKVDGWLERRLGVLADAVQQLPGADQRRLRQALPVLERLAATLDRDHPGAP